MSPSKFVLDIKYLTFLQAGPPLPSVIPADYIPNQATLDIESPNYIRKDHVNYTDLPQHKAPELASCPSTSAYGVQSSRYQNILYSFQSSCRCQEFSLADYLRSNYPVKTNQTPDPY